MSRRALHSAAMAALCLLIAHIGKVTSAVTDWEPSYAECLNNMTTWYPTQMVALMLRGGDEWMIQHMYCNWAHKPQTGALRWVNIRNTHFKSSKTNTVLLPVHDCLVGQWTDLFHLFQRVHRPYSDSRCHVKPQLPTGATGRLGLGFSLIRQSLFEWI